MNTNAFIPKVILAGAGPGDAELITVKLAQALAVADVIVVDRLVNPAIITSYAQPNAEIIFAGKQGYSNASVPQAETNRLLVDLARQGRRVVRLKGGDVAFFSNVLDELQELSRYQIPFEIIPGITAASGASAYAGIPLTARGYARSVRFIAFEEENSFSTNEWLCLANSPDTLVLYMTIKKLPAFTRQLKKFSDEPDKPFAIIEQATTPFQRVHIFSLNDDEALWTGRNFNTPGLVIVGHVVKLHQSFNWFQTATENGTLFQALPAIH